MINGIRLNYNNLRKQNPKTAREAILQILDSCNGNIAQTARILNTTRHTVYKAIKKRDEGNLDDLPRKPKRIHNKTKKHIVDKVIAIKNRTNYGPLHIANELETTFGIQLSPHTIRNILRRNKGKIKYKYVYTRHRKKRQFIDWYTAKPFEIVQIDLKHIIEKKALSGEQIIHIHENKLPLYQWSAIDVNSRFKLIAYSYEKSWTNGLTWYLFVTSWLRSHGVTNKIVYTVDNGEEFGGRSWIKMKELRKLLAGFGCKVIQNRKGHSEENAFVERSHKTDDEEFYIPRILSINSKEQFFKESLNYIYYYNNVRKHSGIGYKTPFEHLKGQLPYINDKIRIVPPIILDKVSVELERWSGFEIISQTVNHVLAQYLLYPAD